MYHTALTHFQKNYTMDGDSSTTLHSYKVTYEVPEFSIENLKAVKTNEGQETNPYFMTKYTQLPEALLQRVRDLASSLTKDKDTRYDKVLAIENYFTDHSLYMKQRMSHSLPKTKIM